jgi:hypothetical protein
MVNTARSPGFRAPGTAHSTQMVNDRFPARSIYGFEMVDVRPAGVAPRRQSIVYAESNHSGFQRIFGDFTSMQTLAVYRPLLIRNKPADLTATNED